MKDLIARLEAATEGSRELDGDIWLATDPEAAQGVMTSGVAFGDRTWSAEDDRKMCLDRLRRNAPRFTTSLDAAVTLVPPGFAWKVGTCHVSDDAWVVPDLNCPVHGQRLRKQFEPLQRGSIWDMGIDIDQRPAGRPAIALCIAALTARMEMK